MLEMSVFHFTILGPFNFIFTSGFNNKEAFKVNRRFSCELMTEIVFCPNMPLVICRVINMNIESVVAITILWRSQVVAITSRGDHNTSGVNRTWSLCSRGCVVFER